MGSCLSSSSNSDYSTGGSSRKPCAHVVSATGQLCQYPVPITVSHVLNSETSENDSFFLCHSDKLYFDDYIPSLELNEELEQSQIYFVLPISKLRYRLAASDMASLAVKASVAMEKINRRSGNRKARISPVMAGDEGFYSDNDKVNGTKISSFGSGYKKEGSDHKLKVGVSRSSSVRKLSRYSSRRAKLAVRSFRVKLNTIYEGSVLRLS